MFVIANCLLGNAPYLGGFLTAETLEEAQKIAVKMALEQLGEDGDDDEDAVREEIESDNSYYDPNGEWSVCIGIPG